MKIELQLLLVCDPDNPNETEYDDYFLNRFNLGKQQMEDYLTEYAKVGILPRQNDIIHFTDSNGDHLEWLVFKPLMFYKDFITIFIEPI